MRTHYVLSVPDAGNREKSDASTHSASLAVVSSWLSTILILGKCKVIRSIPSS